jgi:FkbM family methyltransferase
MITKTESGLFFIANQNETIQRSLIKNGAFEPHIITIAEFLIRKFECKNVFDVGANLGSFAIPIAIKCPASTLYCIEPQPLVFGHLCTNIFLNRLKNVRPINAALVQNSADRDQDFTTVKVPNLDVFSERFTGSVSLLTHVQEIRRGMPNVAEPITKDTLMCNVLSVSLSTFVEKFEVRPTFIKVDVEGMEEQVLSGGLAYLQEVKPILLFESWDLKEFSFIRDSLLAFVRSLGYFIFKSRDDCVAVKLESLTSELRSEFVERGWFDL